MLQQLKARKNVIVMEFTGINSPPGDSNKVFNHDIDEMGTLEEGATSPMHVRLTGSCALIKTPLYM